ncbi:chromatin protein Cren7 [Metallosphaera tengchongensis]|uniref:Chromatin protein Cren7 n=1 Tax=Metallosphaera tengchongensis TaxID=1532350 RepID=A0A6N0NV05_9CREN|nr:chromatin protein Cren7 [Metallosphaera tengchongensis]QKQ99317.1 chromatin protein Cren7 [Metallosphaera tengchongensis]
MPKRKQSDPDICPNCGTKAEKPIKTWNLVSPLPDAYGRITITVMGSYECSKCGHRWRTVVSKIRAGGSDVEVEGKKGVKKIGGEKGAEKQEEGEVIELDLGDLDEDEEE